MRTSPAVDQLLLYALALAAKGCGIEVHSFVFLSNHHHIVLTDVYGTLPFFCQIFHSLVARGLNCYHGRRGYFWDQGSYSAVQLETAGDVLDAIEYARLNPVQAELVERCCEWPGLISAPSELAGGRRLGIRPKLFFSKRSKCPAEVELKLKFPKMFEKCGWTEKVVIQRLEERLALKEALIGERVKSAGRTFLGAEGVKAQSPFASPSSYEPQRQRNPSVAAKDKERRIAALERLVEFRRAYASCRERFRDGDRDVLFPWGTYGPKEVYGARVRSPVPD